MTIKAPDFTNATINPTTDLDICPGGNNCHNPDGCDDCNPEYAALWTGHNIANIGHLGLQNATNGKTRHAGHAITMLNNIEAGCERMDPEALRHIVRGFLHATRLRIEVALDASNTSSTTPDH